MEVKSRSVPAVRDPPTDSIRRLIRAASWVVVPCSNNSAVRLAIPNWVASSVAEPARTRTCRWMVGS